MRINKFCNLRFRLKTNQYIKNTTGKKTAYVRELNSIYQIITLNNEKSKVIERFGNMENNSIMDYVVLVFMGIVIIFVMDSIMKMAKK